MTWQQHFCAALFFAVLSMAAAWNEWFVVSFLLIIAGWATYILGLKEMMSE